MKTKLKPYSVFIDHYNFGPTPKFINIFNSPKFTIKDVRAIAIDGINVWVGTWGLGLAMYDGTNWTLYDNISNPGLPNNYITSLAIESYNNIWNIWVGTADPIENPNSIPGGVAKFNGSTWKYFDYSLNNFPYNYVFSIAIDSSNNKWVGIENSGGNCLVKIDSNNYVTSIDTSVLGLTTKNYVRYICTTKEGSDDILWIASWGGGLAKYDIASGNWTVYNTSNSSLPCNYITSIAIEGSDTYSTKWIGTFGGGLAKYWYDGYQWQWTVFQNIPNSNSLPDNFVLSIAIDSGNNKWVGTRFGGLVKFDGYNTWKQYNTGLSDNLWIPSLAVQGSNIWVGTHYDGIAEL